MGLTSSGGLDRTWGQGWRLAGAKEQTVLGAPHLSQGPAAGMELGLGHSAAGM